MNAKKVKQLYDEVIKLDAGSKYIKFDLHIHTPGSSDFVGSKFLNREEQYLEILDSAMINGIQIIAITDHNTFKGYNELKSIINSNNALNDKYKSLLILCGIEISCFSKHLLAVFNSDFSKDNQKKFLEDIGINPEIEGTESAMADLLGPALLLEKINKYGGISILAHADTKMGFFIQYAEIKMKKLQN